MKKKTILFIFSILVILLGILIFSRKIDFIKSIENIKSKKIEEKEITKVDVTDLEDNGNLDHEHLFKTMYDEDKHWEECTICGVVNNESKHSYVTTWATGSESCNSNNYYTKTCACGYSYIGHKPCVWNGSNYAYGGYRHYKRCSVCNGFCYNGYYLNNKLYYEPASEQCHASNGKLIDCNTGGYCVVCRNNCNKGEHNFSTDHFNSILKCGICGNKYGEVLQEVEQISNDAPVSYRMVTEYNLVNATYNSIENINRYPTVFQSVSRRKLSFQGESNTHFKIETIVQFNQSYKVGASKYFNTFITIDGKKTTINEVIPFFIYPDIDKPKISSITMGNGNEELTEWSRTKPIVISGTENYCNNVIVKILDDKESIIFEGGGVVKNNNYSVLCIPEIEVDTNGKPFKVIVTDACENIAEREFTISKVDAIPPVAKSSDDITGEWMKSKKFTFKATDYGSGEVSIAFNDIKNLGLARFNEGEYSRDYEFYGDVYQPKQLSVLYRDKLGNTSIQKVTIDKLDNTAPTITNTSICNNVVSVVANDVHEKLGEGSGVVKYRYIASEEKLDSPDVSSGKEISSSEKIVVDEIYKVKYVYIEAEDLVGNVSEVYEFKIPELVLTSRVDTSLADGKGGVILDWSTYDIADKYFVIYRKEENATKWETIVSLEGKLTGSGYTDILANDKSKPNISNINIRGDAENNNIKINATSNNNGSNYSYYIEAYDSNNMETLLNFSNII